jgi:hypothetical protein
MLRILEISLKTLRKCNNVDVFPIIMPIYMYANSGHVMSKANDQFLNCDPLNRKRRLSSLCWQQI